VTHTEYVDIISGKRQGAWWEVVRALLWCVSLFYLAGGELRKLLYRYDVLKSTKLPVAVISIGNLTTGGTGKTPLVEHLARLLGERGHKVVIVSRGYKPSASRADVEVNDEYLVLEENLPGVPHIVDSNRVRACLKAYRAYGADVVVLDDGFQHLAARRDLDIVVVDATNPFGYGFLLPRGLLREPESALGRSDAVVVTRINLVSAEQRRELLLRIEALNPGGRLYTTALRPSALSDASVKAELDTVEGQPVVAFCGIGNPEAFRLTVVGIGAALEAFVQFDDHHQYAPRDIKRIISIGRSRNCTFALTTQKDFVKLHDYIGAFKAAGIKLFYVQTDIEVLEDEDLSEEIEKTLPRRALRT